MVELELPDDEENRIQEKFDTNMAYAEAFYGIEQAVGGAKVNVGKISDNFSLDGVSLGDIFQDYFQDQGNKIDFLYDGKRFDQLREKVYSSPGVVEDVNGLMGYAMDRFPEDINTPQHAFEQLYKNNELSKVSIVPDSYGSSQGSTGGSSGSNDAMENSTKKMGLGVAAVAAAGLAAYKVLS